MTAPNGYNPIRWKCEERGCFNVKKRPKIEVFADCLPGRIAFSDVDATVEVNGRFLFLEFKEGEPRELQTGQRIYLQRLTLLHRNIQAAIVSANSETMEIAFIRAIRLGQFGPVEKCDLAALRARIRSWAVRASALPTVRIAA